ncbi:MAG: hypothetical protein WBI47_00945 [Atribacterales bacterium]
MLRRFASRIFSLLQRVPPLAGGSARLPCQIIDLAGWVRKGEVFQQRDFLREKHFEGS